METWARRLAHSLLAGPLPHRWRHVRAVAEAARRIQPVFEPDGELLVAAAYLHDIGYSPSLTDTGIHQIDGARFLRAHGAPRRLVDLVAHHSLAVQDAVDQGWSSLLAEFTDERTAVRDALWFCDMTIGPDGQAFSIRERIVEIGRRYGPDHPKTRIREATAPERLRVARRTQRLLRAAGLVSGSPSAPMELDVPAVREGDRREMVWLRRMRRTISEDLADAFGHLPAEHVQAVVEQTYDELSETAAVTDFLPVLVHRRAARRLAEERFELVPA
ncbi:MAG TPA: HD domain-containing protein [Pseudonocardiaceae bacterium]|nr:HD domain-containing protein [Pseudonocardiaceae bacterium]